MRLVLVVAGLVWMLAGCGFKPIYAESTGVRTVLQDIYVVTPPTPSGYEMRQALVNDFGSGRATASAPYHLDITTRSALSGFGLRVDDVSTRFEIAVQAQYILRDVTTETVLSQGTVNARSSYDAPVDPFSELAAQEAARERATKAAAEDIRRAIQFDLFGRSEAP